MKKATKSILSLTLALAMVGGATACTQSVTDNTEVLGKISSLEARVILLLSQPIL